MIPLSNELESFWCQQLTEHIKIILPQKFEGERLIGISLSLSDEANKTKSLNIERA